MLIGVPGSGKSTWIQHQDWFQNCAYISSDMHIENYAKEMNKTYSEVFKEYISTASSMMIEDVVSAREFKKDIIWDQTNVTRSSRAKKIRMLPGYRKVAIFFRTPDEEELNSRLRSRKGKHIPKKSMNQMIKWLELPTREEGFDEIWFAN
jgi:predicted kinase